MTTPSPTETTPGPRNILLSIFLVSVLGLFLEMMLIRWIGTEIRIFAYLQNTVLVVCFLGLGMGCFSCRKPIRMRQILIPLLCLTTIMGIPFFRQIAGRITDLLSVMNDLLIWQHAMNDGPAQTALRVFLGLSLTLALMVLLWEMFVPLGRILGRLMNDHPRTIQAYSINVAGSLVGIWLFVALSAMSLSPVFWILATCILLFAFLGRGRDRVMNYGLVTLILLTGWMASYESDAIKVDWSPYQKLVLQENNSAESRWSGKYLINVNNAGYQGIIDLSKETTSATPIDQESLQGLSQYDLPTRLHPNPQNVLIVGAGSGNDVAGVLRGGAKQVTAVEIDPAIIRMGREYHPEQPYQSERVTIVNDDARSFFATTGEKQYDLIVFGLLDSHTTTAMTNARLDHYVYTRESLMRAKRLLTENGTIFLSFEAAKPFIAERMGHCLKDVFGKSPMAFRVPTNESGWGGMVFVTGNEDHIQTVLNSDTSLANKIAEWQAASTGKATSTANFDGNSQIITDDWPYIYLEHASIPSLYYLLGGLMLVLVGYSKYRLRETKMFRISERSDWHFFLLGAAFLLLEVQNISKASVVLGNTWVVNAVIISGIMFMILLANLIAVRFPRLRTSYVVVGIIGTCLALYAVDLSSFGFLPFAVKAVIVGSLTTVPLLFSGIIFIRSFAAVKDKHRALGANLMGSLVGGLLQSITFVVGIKALLLVVAGLYIAAILCKPPQEPSQSENESQQLDDIEKSDVVVQAEPEEVLVEVGV